MGDELFDLLAPAVASFGLELLDVEHRPGLVRLVVDGPGGAQLDAIAEATRAVSHLLDGHDPQPGRRYTLEVTSPGVERPLRTPAHFARAVGETVSVRTTGGDPGSRRYKGKLLDADDRGIVVDVHEGGTEGGAGPAGTRRFEYADIDRARTVFEWGSSEEGGAGQRDRKHARRTAGGRGTDRKKVTTP